jgi:O-methyltransferase
METGVWRGGAVVFMRAVLKRHGIADRIVWAADSFEGLPPPKENEDKKHRGCDLSNLSYLTVSLENVQAAFRRFGLLDDQVRFVKGWFRDSLPKSPVQRLAVLRLDGDMYESTRDSLVPLYPKVSPGGFVIVDDYHDWPGCKRAVDEYRDSHGIRAPIKDIAGGAVYWRA